MMCPVMGRYLGLMNPAIVSLATLEFRKTDGTGLCAGFLADFASACLELLKEKLH